MNLVPALAVAAVVVIVLGIGLLVAARRRPVPVAASAPYDADDGIVSEPVPIERAAVLEADLPLVGVAPRPVVHEPEATLEPEPEPESVLEQAEPAPDEPPSPRDMDAATGSAGVAEAQRTTRAESADQPEPVRTPATTEVCWAKRFAPRSGALDDSARLGLIRDLGLVRAPWGVPLLLQAYDEEPDAAHRRAVLAALALYRHLDGRPVFERALRSDDEAERAIAGAALADLGVTPSLTS